MKDLTRVSFKLIKTDDGDWYNLALKKLNKLLDSCEPGTYRFTIEKESSRLQKMKKFYFQMETNLAQHLGIKKTDLHKTLMSEFTKFDTETEKEVYDSIAEIKEEDAMMVRILDFQHYASIKHNYTSEPYSEEE